MKRLLSVAMVLLWTTLAHANPEITVDLPGGTTMELVWIEPGTFLMGLPASKWYEWPDEGPQHLVSLTRGFWLGRTEVTQGQWQTVLGTEPWALILPQGPAVSANCPAVGFTEDDVYALVHRLNQAAGDSLYRLPTEAEWEYACRAGTTTYWSFGDDGIRAGDYVWHSANTYDLGLDWAQPVGTKLPNPWGLYDMHGNVWEMVQDRPDGTYGSGAVTDPLGPPTGRGHTIRGGYFRCVAEATRSTIRGVFGPTTHDRIVGIRLLRMAPAPTSVDPIIWGQVKNGGD